MACHLPLPPLPKKPKSPPATPTTICALGDDLLREIFLRLPSLPALVRAALTCRSSLRAVGSCPAFRRRFREFHSPPIVGLFINTLYFNTPAFRPLCLRPDPDIVAVVRRADFFLAHLPNNYEGSAPRWLIRDCHYGYVVLISQNTEHLAVYNPLTRVLHLLPARSAKRCTLSSMSSPRKKTRVRSKLSVSVTKFMEHKPPSSHQKPGSGRFSHGWRLQALSLTCSLSTRTILLIMECW
ncbi:hypothetical protein ACQ4PT_015309 [Festuca glaucescens]